MKNQRNIKLVRGAILAGAFLQLFLFWNGSVNANPPPPPNCCECQYLTEQLICATKQEYIPYKPIGPVTGGTFNWTPDWAIQLNQVMGASEIGPFVFTSPPMYSGTKVKDDRDYCCPDPQRGICIGQFRLSIDTKIKSAPFSASAGTWCWTDALPWGVGKITEKLNELFGNEDTSAVRAWLDSIASLALGTFDAYGYTDERIRSYQEGCAGCGSQNFTTGSSGGFASAALGQASFGVAPFYAGITVVNGYYSQVTYRYVAYVGAPVNSMMLKTERFRDQFIQSSAYLGTHSWTKVWVYSSPVTELLDVTPVCIGPNMY